VLYEMAGNPGLTLVHFSVGREHKFWDTLGTCRVSVTETAEVELSGQVEAPAGNIRQCLPGVGRSGGSRGGSRLLVLRLRRLLHVGAITHKRLVK